MADAFAQLTAHQVAFWIRARPAIRNLIEYIVLLPGRVRRYRRIFLAHLPLSQVIKTKIGHDAVDPGIKRALETKIADALVRLQESFLVNILGFGFRAGEMESQPQHCLVVVPHQLLESGATAALRLADQ